MLRFTPRVVGAGLSVLYRSGVLDIAREYQITLELPFAPHAAIYDLETERRQEFGDASTPHRGV